MKKKYYSYIVNGKKGIVESWSECQEKIKGQKNPKYKSFKTLKDAKAWLEDPEKFVGVDKAKKKKYYGYVEVGGNQKGIVESWDECQKIIKSKKVRYKSFKGKEEAKRWVDDGGKYLSKEELQKNLEEGIYFDAGTGRGIGVEMRVTDKEGVPILHYLIPEEKINKYGNYLLEKGRTNNFGELLGLYSALSISKKIENKKIFGDSMLVIKYWSLGMVKKDNVDEKTYDLALKVTRLRKEFEKGGGEVKHVSGDINPADLGFHK